MSKFKCRVMSCSGNVHTLRLDGFSKEDIVEYLRKSSFVIIDVKKVEEGLKEVRLISKVYKINSKELSLFCKQMSTMLKSGINIVKCMEILSIQTENKKFRNVVAEIYKELLMGSTFSEAVINHKISFPNMFVTMVRAGELSGNIDVVMWRLSSHYEKENKIENKVKSALMYPVILSIVSIGVVTFLLIKVMPTFVDLYKSSGVSLPFMTLLLLNISQWLRNMWLYLLLFVLAFSVAANRLCKNEEIRASLDSWKLNVPLFGMLKVKLAAARFCRTLSTLLGSGVSLIEALGTVSMIVGNEYISRCVLNAREDVKQGSSLAFSVEKQNVFPPIVFSMIKLGEEAGEVVEVLNKTADFFDDEVENAIQKLVALIEPVMIVAMAVFVGFILLSMITPMFDMVNTVQ